MPVEQHGMSGFKWTDHPQRPPSDDGSNGYCLRDAVCQLLEWPEESAEWMSFREYPAPGDEKRLYDYLGFTIYDISIAEHWNELVPKVDAPGIASFVMPSAQIAHCVYVPRVRDVLQRWSRPDGKPLPISSSQGYGYPLHPDYMTFNPQLWWIVLGEPSSA